MKVCYNEIMSVLNYFERLHAERRELALLQWAYLAMVVVSVIVAGVFALINQSLGVSILVVPVVAFVAMSMNVVAWALIKLAADTFISKKPGSDKKKR